MIKKFRMALLLLTLATVISRIDYASAQSTPDGAALYAQNCASCHGALASSEERGRSATQIQNAINANRGGMGRLSNLTTAQVQAIANALSQQAPPPPPPPPATDGAGLYAQNCASCHGALASSEKRGRTASQIQSAINADRGGMGSSSLRSLTSAQIQAIANALAQQTPPPPPPPPVADGPTLYAQNCASCHGALASSEKRGRTASQIQSAINADRGGMGSSSLRSLTSAQVQAIANALAQQTPPPPPPPPVVDGPTLYAQNCASCHGALASSSKIGRSATQIQSAINGNAGGMGYLSSLTTAQVQAIANALAQQTPPPPPPPTADGPTLYAQSCASCHGSLTSSSKKARTAAQIQSAINGNTGGMGYLSNLTSAQLQAIADALSGPDTKAPTVTGFSIPSTANSLSIFITTFTASDNIAVTGHMVTESATPPSASAPGWSATSPWRHTFATPGKKTLYAWAKDAAGNVSASRSASATVTSTSPPPPPVVDGPTLYAQNCASCHGSLASSSKKGRTANQIQNAINGNVGDMGYLSSLTAAQVQAIADALTGTPSSDTTRPTVTEFSIPATATSLTVSITTFTATDNVAVTGYVVTESATAPSASATGWATPPASSYTFATAGAKTLYAWAKDAAGNVSASKSATVTITISDNPQEMAIWIGKWFKITEKNKGYNMGGSGMNKDQLTSVGYLRIRAWDSVNKVLQGDRYQQDQNGQWFSELLNLNFIAGSELDFLCWSQVTGDYVAVFTARIQGKEEGGALKNATFKTLGGFYVEVSAGAGASPPEQYAGGLTISGALTAESKVPVPSDLVH